MFGGSASHVRKFLQLLSIICKITANVDNNNDNNNNNNNNNNINNIIINVIQMIKFYKQFTVFSSFSCQFLRLLLHVCEHAPAHATRTNIDGRMKKAIFMPPTTGEKF